MTNPAKRAKIEDDLGRGVADLIVKITDLCETNVLCYVVEDTKRNSSNFCRSVGSLGFDQVFDQVQGIWVQIPSLVDKHLVKAGAPLKLDFNPLIAVILRLLRIQISSAKADGIDVASFKKFTSQLESLHRWAFSFLVKVLHVSGPFPMIMFRDSLKDLLEHYLRNAPEVVHGFLLWLCSEEGNLLVDLRKAIGPKLVDLIARNLNGPHKSMMIRLSSAVLTDPIGFGVTLAASDSLFQTLVDLMLEMAMDPLGNDDLVAELLEALCAGSLGSLPSCLSPRAPVVIKLISMLTGYTALLGPASLKSCSRAVRMLELALHPVKALPAVELATRRKRDDAIRTALDAAPHEVAAPVQMESVPLMQTQIKVNTEALPIPSFESKVPVKQEVPATSVPQPAQQQVHYPPPHPVMSNDVPTAPVDEEEDDDAPIPEFTLD